jgi:hypothetical protein
MINNRLLRSRMHAVRNMNTRQRSNLTTALVCALNSGPWPGSSDRANTVHLLYATVNLRLMDHMGITYARHGYNTCSSLTALTVRM